jgi:heme/copper-type cytochrome/quinol oxidase subunit 1
LGLLVFALLVHPNYSAGRDVHLFGSYFVVVQPAFLWVAGVLQGVFAGVYLAFPALTRGSYRETLGRLHFLLNAVATAMIAAAPFLASKVLPPNNSPDLEEFIAAGPVFLLVGQVPFFLLFGRDKVKSV